MGQSSSHRVRGKLILFGEHAVVYGTPALAVPVPRGLTITAAAAAGGPHLHAPCWEVSIGPGARDPATERLQAALERAFELSPGAPRDLLLTVDSDIPRRAGLGSSAALAVALVRCLAAAAREPLSVEQEISRALEIEKIFHGTPSGVDHTTVALDRPLVFLKEETRRPPIALAQPLSIVVAAVGSHGETVQRVSTLAERRQALPQLFGELFETIGSIANRALRALREGDLTTLGTLMDLNQGLLNGLGVSSVAIEQALFAARAAGALGAKLSGAGGGGAVLALCQQETTGVEQALQGLGWPTFLLRLVPDAEGNASVGEGDRALGS